MTGIVEFAPRPTRALIDLAALRHNLRQARTYCAAGQGVLAVIKADAYGHGAVRCGKALEAAGVEHFGVATLEEGLELRGAGIRRPILVLGGCYPGQEEAFVRHDLTAALFDGQDLERLDRFGRRRKKPLAVHVKCDTGMGRVGFLPDEVPALVRRLSDAPGLRVVGLMSHLARADELACDLTSGQIRIFRRILADFAGAGIRPAAIHLSNSAGLSAWPVPECTLVRPGIMLYGGCPGAGFDERLDLRPVMTLETRITQLRTLPPGSGISYGHSYRTMRPTRLATLPIGYADGYSRLLSNRAEVLVRGRRVPQVGRVCMDWVLVDVTDVAEAAVGDRVVLLGCDGDERISAEEWAAKVGTINYEVFCGISRRVPRQTLG